MIKDHEIKAYLGALEVIVSGTFFSSPP